MSDEIQEPEGEEDPSASQQPPEGLQAQEPTHVLARIESLVAEFVAILASEGRIMPITLMPLALPSGALQQALAPQGLQDVPTAGRARPLVRSLHAANGAGAMAYVRMFVVLQAIHELLLNQRTATQRDLYYKLQRPPIISASKDIDAAIQDVSRILAVPRSSLGVTCCSRGAVAGRLYVRDTPASAWQDCTMCGSGGKAIPGDIRAIESLSFQTSASYLMVIEKDAVFQRLCQDRLFDALSVILVTAKGHPDLATRAFCTRLTESFPLTVLGFVDYNPAGAVILRTYKFGSQRSSLESPRYAMPSLYWLGLHSSWLADITTEHLQQLTARDRSMIPNLKASFHPGNQAGIEVEHWEQLEQWVGELDTMEETGYKADIEAVYSLAGYAGLKDMVVSTVLRKQYI